MTLAINRWSTHFSFRDRLMHFHCSPLGLQVHEKQRIQSLYAARIRYNHWTSAPGTFVQPIQCVLVTMDVPSLRTSIAGKARETRGWPCRAVTPCCQTSRPISDSRTRALAARQDVTQVCRLPRLPSNDCDCTTKLQNDPDIVAHPQLPHVP
jgi:hypothetical protein